MYIHILEIVISNCDLKIIIVSLQEVKTNDKQHFNSPTSTFLHTPSSSNSPKRQNLFPKNPELVLI